MKYLLSAWFAICMISLLQFAFTGHAWWAPLTEADMMRFAILFLFHTAGLAALPLTRIKV